MSYPGHSLGGGSLALCRGAVGVFYSPSRLGNMVGAVERLINIAGVRTIMNWRRGFKDKYLVNEKNEDSKLRTVNLTFFCFLNSKRINVVDMRSRKLWRNFWKTWIPASSLLRLQCLSIFEPGVLMSRETTFKNSEKPSFFQRLFQSEVENFLNDPCDDLNFLLSKSGRLGRCHHHHHHHHVAP